MFMWEQAWICLLLKFLFLSDERNLYARVVKMFLFGSIKILIFCMLTPNNFHTGVAGKKNNKLFGRKSWT